MSCVLKSIFSLHFFLLIKSYLESNTTKIIILKIAVILGSKLISTVLFFKIN